MKLAQPNGGVLLTGRVTSLTIGTAFGRQPPQLDGIGEQHTRQSKSIHWTFSGQLGPERSLRVGLFRADAGHAVKRGIDQRGFGELPADVQ